MHVCIMMESKQKANKRTIKSSKTNEEQIKCILRRVFLSLYSPWWHLYALKKRQREKCLNEWQEVFLAETEGLFASTDAAYIAAQRTMKLSPGGAKLLWCAEIWKRRTSALSLAAEPVTTQSLVKRYQKLKALRSGAPLL
uniref:uncharacterized protein LOC113474472 n=1 Tax=Ciona intestinalis TaxID=7719 RepID=UPI000EF4E4DA|nr:uncharacterized protein LOC113474472 [Ciona intestinalis]|eukprot:XP_026691508.1 uncharacterized protein LOC113474472 [Ciona intestinalis]